MNQKELIIRVINTLDQITVSGAANMDKLLGCILALRKIVSDNAQPENGQPDNAQPDGINIEPQAE